MCFSTYIVWHWLRWTWLSSDWSACQIIAPRFEHVLIRCKPCQESSQSHSWTMLSGKSRKNMARETNQHQLTWLFFMCRSTHLHTLDKITPQWVCPNIDIFTCSGLSQASDRFERQLFATNCAAYCWGLRELTLFKWSANGCSSAGWPWIRYFLRQGSLSPLTLALRLKIDLSWNYVQMERPWMLCSCVTLDFGFFLRDSAPLTSHSDQKWAKITNSWIVPHIPEGWVFWNYVQMDAYGCSTAGWPWILDFFLQGSLSPLHLALRRKISLKLQTLELCHIFLGAESLQTVFKWSAHVCSSAGWPSFVYFWHAEAQKEIRKCADGKICR